MQIGSGRINIEGIYDTPNRWTSFYTLPLPPSKSGTLQLALLYQQNEQTMDPIYTHRDTNISHIPILAINHDLLRIREEYATVHRTENPTQVMLQIQLLNITLPLMLLSGVDDTLAIFIFCNQRSIYSTHISDIGTETSINLEEEIVTLDLMFFELVNIHYLEYK